MTQHHQPANRSRLTSITLIVLSWAILQIGGLFSPGLLDDVDSIYIQIAREMLQRHDFVTPTIDGIRFFDKPPLMYWLAAGSMHLFGIHDWAARLPLALGVLALLFAVYALGNRLFAPNPCSLIPNPCSGRPGLYAALVLATAIGPYLYTRFFIPDILIALWMTLSVHLFLIALDRIATDRVPQAFSQATDRVPRSFSFGSHSPTEEKGGLTPAPSPLLPCLAFAAVTALNLLTKGLIGIVFPIGFVVLYLAITRNLKALLKLHLLASTAVFLLIAAPWHVLAALRNPAIPMPAGVGLPARAGWAWFYLYNEHVARFLGRRIPHDYGQTPVWLFWLYAVLWIMPWAAFLPAALRNLLRKSNENSVILSEARSAQSKDPDAFSPTSISSPFSTSTLNIDQRQATDRLPPGFSPSINQVPQAFSQATARVPRSFSFGSHSPAEEKGFSPGYASTALTLTLWPLIVLLFFTLSSRQEYYSLPAIPALALIVAGLLARADHDPNAARNTLTCHRWILLPIASLVALVCAFFAITAPHPAPGADLSTLLASNPDLYNVSLGHLFDLTGAAMGLFRGPLATVALGMAVLGPVSFLLRRKSHTYAANLTLAAGMTLVLLAAHEGLVRFNPILGSKDLALKIEAVRQPGDLIVIDGELTAGSTLLFYTHGTQPVLLVNGHINGPWFGSFWPDAPKIFLDDAQLHTLWAGPHRVFLLTYHPEARTVGLTPFAPVAGFAHSGGKSILTNK